MSGINLIPELTEKDRKTSVSRARANKAAVVSLIVLAIVIGALISYRVFLELKASDISKRTQTAEAKIQDLKDIELSQLTLSDKVSQVKTLLQNALPGSVALTQVTQAAQGPSPINLRKVEINNLGDVLVEGGASDSTAFAAWIDNLTTSENAKVFQQIKLTSLTKDDAGFSFTLNMAFTQKGVQPKL